ncbi:MAG: reverse transcriptase/maturase family protein [Candidatus Pacebacteria bacterium]|nr:reverse transcriptase/maturase family protein [Candidatus Paceibacterota bacterium]
MDNSNITNKHKKECRKQDLFSFRNLLKAYYQCRKRKRKTVNASKFELDFENELLRLEKELTNKTYKIGNSICFVVTYPTPREIFAADFKDRIVHHLFINHIEKIWNKKFIHHSYACRKNKGAHEAIKDLRKTLRKISCDFSCPVYYLQVDISAFFMSLKKDILFDLICKHLKNPQLLWLAKQIIFHDPTKDFYCKSDKKLFELIPDHKSLFKVPCRQGLPIGNLTSQFFANIYMNELDQFAKHNLKIKYYFRYVDDILIIDEDPKQLENWKNQINIFLKTKLEIHLHPKKSKLRSIYKGINFVGFIIKPNYLIIRKRTISNLKRKLWQFNQFFVKKDYIISKNQLEKILAVINSYYGHFKHANTYNLKKSIYQKHFKKLEKYIVPANENFDYFELKSSHTTKNSFSKNK